MTDEKEIDHGIDNKSEKTTTRKSGRVRFSAVIADCDKDEDQICTERRGRSRDRSASSGRAKRSPTPFVRRSPSAYSSADDGNDFQDDDDEERDEDRDDGAGNSISRNGSLRNRRHIRDRPSREKSSETNQKGACSEPTDAHPLENDENKENGTRPVSHASLDRFDHIGEFEFIADDFGSASLTQHGWNSIETSEFEEDTTNTMHALRTELSHQSLQECRSRTSSIDETMYDFDTCTEVEIHIYSDDNTKATGKSQASE